MYINRYKKCTLIYIQKTKRQNKFTPTTSPLIFLISIDDMLSFRELPAFNPGNTIYEVDCLCVGGVRLESF